MSTTRYGGKAFGDTRTAKIAIVVAAFVPRAWLEMLKVGAHERCNNACAQLLNQRLTKERARLDTQLWAGREAYYVAAQAMLVQDKTPWC